MLPKNFEEPNGFKWGSFYSAEGNSLRYGHLPPAGEAKGTIVILPGFREAIEKYFEVVNDMTSRGYAVYIMDWPGQGGSDRLLWDNQQKMHSEGYDRQISALHQFVDTVVEKDKQPLIMLGHSMGAHIGLRYLKEHEGVFDSAMLSAPMFDITTGGMPKPLARQISKFAKAGNYLDKYIPGGADWSEDKEIFKANLKTSDPVRFSVTTEIYKLKPDLKAGDATYGWIYHTFASLDILVQEEYLKSIKTPILMQLSGDEAVVSRAAQERALTLLPNCRHVDIAGARHEIWMEQDSLRDQWVAEIDTFLAERQQKATPAPKNHKPQGLLKPPKAA